MGYAVIIIIAILIIAGVSNSSKNKEKSKKDTTIETSTSITAPDYTQGYKSKWMFSCNEKDAYKKIKEITDELNLVLFAKVRLFDLIEPKKGIENGQIYQNKIQSKHVDFVICDSKLVARVVIEYDDASHDAQTREERDIFVNAALSNCGYKVLHMRSIEPDKLKNQLTSVFFPVSS
jgi:hypothetical protein